MDNGRPSNAEISDAKARCYEYYKDFKSILFCAEKTKLNRNTVSKYYAGFGRITLEQDKQKFIEAQKVTKEQIIYKLETMIDRGEKQLKRLQYQLGIEDDNTDEETSMFSEDMDETTKVKLEQLINKVQGDLINWNQQKAVIVDSPTLDIKIDDLVEDRIRELDEREAELSKKESEIAKHL